MKKIVIVVYLLTSTSLVWSQEDFLAKQYFEDGEFNKAVVFYEKLVQKNPRRTDFCEALVTCYQQLEQYQKAEEFLLNKLKDPFVFPTYYIELGYTYALNNQKDKAQEQYQNAVDAIDQNPNFGYSIGFRFQKYALLDQAIAAYTKAMDLKPQLNYNFQLARIYGEQGNVEKMFIAYLTLLENGTTSQANVLRNIKDFIDTNAEEDNNQILRKILFKNAQKKPNILWNELLSWLFIQQQQYSKAFVQEKAIYKRSAAATIDRLENLGTIAQENKDLEVANSVYTYISQNASDPVTQLNAALQLIDIELLLNVNLSGSTIVKKYETLLEQYGIGASTIQLPIAYANYVTFTLNQPKKSIEILQPCLQQPLGKFAMAKVKMALANILVYDQKFNQALIYYTQVQKQLKNDVMGQNARFKVAKTSFFKGDFDWALTQLKVLRSSTSQLIANDAMQLSLFISDNILEDSTHTALKKYAKADLLAYQNQKEEALNTLENLITDHKGDTVEDEALMRYAQLLTQKNRFQEAANCYLKIITFFSDDILADDAHFALGLLYEKQLNAPQKAKEQYEKIIYNHQDSYYFPQARKNFRRLRGDLIN